MTPDEHDNPETPVARETTELFPFSSGSPATTRLAGQAPGREAPEPAIPAVGGAADTVIDSSVADTVWDLPAMEPLPGDALPDPGYPDMSAPYPAAPQAQATAAQSYASGTVDLPSWPAPDPPPRGPVGPVGLAGPVGPVGPVVPWPEDQAGADRPDGAESLAAESLAAESLAGSLTEPLAAAAALEDGAIAGIPRAPENPEAVRETADTLASDLLLPGRLATPDPGWRRTVYRATGGMIRILGSSAAMRRRDRINRIRTPVARGHHRVAVLSLKGGVGKTTTAVGLGATLASLRGDRVIAMDGNPDRGTLSDKVRLQTPATIRDLLNEREMVAGYSHVRAFTSQAPSRLEILASDRDPGVSVAFSADDYRTVAAVLQRYYSVCITDCGTGLLHSAMAGILELADQIVLVSSPSVDGARSASATLDWLAAHGHGDLVSGGVVVLSAIRRKSKSAVDIDRLQHYFAGRCRAVVRIPFDTHLEEGAELELDLLSAGTADAYLELAALVADGFASPGRSAGATTPRFPLA